MYWEVFRFEIRYRLNRPATYIYFFILFLLAFLAVSWDGIRVGGDIGKIKQNASLVLFNMAAILSILPGLFFASAVMGVPVLRDFEHKMESLIFTTSVSKMAYLLGRFLGSFVILLFIGSGFVWGTWLGCHMPWLDKDTLLDAGFWQYVKPWLLLTVPNLFIVAGIFFASGAFSKKMLFVYLQAMLLLAVYFMAQTLIGDVENLAKAAYFDPFGMYALSADTRYWTVAEKNGLVVPLAGYLLKNRLLWMGIALLVMVLSFVLFKFRSVPSGLFKRKGNGKKGSFAKAETGKTIPFAKPIYNAATKLQQGWALTRLYLKETLRGIPFLGMGLIGLIMLLVDADYANKWNGQDLYPVTSMMAGYVADELFAIIALIALFYSGELAWKEKEIRFSQIFDAVSIGDAIPLLSKYFALAMAIGVYLLLMIPIGALIQVFKGYAHIEWGVYVLVLFNRVYISMLVYLAISFFIQYLVGNKFMGYAVSALLYIYVLFADQMKIYNKLLIPDSGSLGNYSDMNGFAAGLDKFLVLKCYWAGVAVVLLALGVLLYPRGTEDTWRERIKAFKKRFRAVHAGWIVAGLLLMVGFGAYYQYNISVLNTYSTEDEDMDRQANFEKTLKKKYERVLQPSVSAIVAKVDLFPETGNLDLNATVTYVNRFQSAINQILVKIPDDDNLNFPEMGFSVPAKLEKNYEQFGFRIYKLGKPMQPGDTMKMSLKGKRVVKGFTNGSSNTSYVRNGTFINNMDIFPMLGYNPDEELSDTKERKKRGLAEQAGLPPRTDTLARKINLFGQRGRTDLDVTIGTAAGQTAIAPGYLQKTWKEGGRAYFHYRMDKPIFNFFNIISGVYEVKREKWNDVNLEVYYHKDHGDNIDLMMQSLKDGLSYDSREFSPYSYRQVRIIEFPRYRQFAQSFSNTIPFSEAMGFLFKNMPDELDMSYYVTAHELGHQWWGHQVCESYTKGNQLFSEGLAQYSALMLMKHHLPQEQISRYLKYELDGYLRGRSSERKKENPLDETDGQSYLHYNKASLAYFALQDYIGEDKVNQALRKLIANYGDQDNYPTSDVLVSYLKEVTPDSLKFVVDDLFSKITLFENRVVDPKAHKKGVGYEVTIPVQTVKYYADTAGNEKATPIKDYIDIGVYAQDAKTGKEKLVYLKRHKFSTGQSTVTLQTAEKPVRAGIDPLFKLVDRNTEDNRAVVTIE